MKPWLQTRTPAQLLWIIAALDALVAAGFGVLELQLWPHQLHPSLYSSIIPIGALLTGVMAEQALRDGIANERWPEASLEGPRRLAAHPVSSILGWLIVVAAVAAFLSVVFTPARHIGVLWIFFWPITSFARVRSYLRQPPTSTAPPQLFGQSTPLQSDHWGTPPRPFSS